MKNHRIFTYFKEIPDINNKNLLHSTGNYIQLLVINYNGRESEKATDHFAVHLKLAQPCKYTTYPWHAKSPQSCLNLCDAMDCSLQGSSVHGNSPGENTGVDCHAFLQGGPLNSGIEPVSLKSPVLVGQFFTTSLTWETQT